MATADEPYSIWTIWADQPEYPDKVVVRRYELPLADARRPSFEAVADDLDAARALLPPGLSKAARSDREDPAMVEMWMIDPRPMN